MKPFKRFGIRWAEPLGLPECPYMVRWVVTFFGFGLRLHRWIASDDQRHMHDHPFWFVNILLWGSYTDVSEAGADVLGPGSIRFRRAAHKHTVLVTKRPTWSLLITGPATRNWGFWVPGRDRLMRPLRYFSRFKHHPCEL